MMRRTNIVNSIDWITVGLFLALVVMGWVNIYAAVYDEDHASIFDLSQRYGKQLIWIVITLIIALAVLYVDMLFFEYFANAVYILMLFVLLGVLLVGHTVHGAKSWYQFGGFLFQPSEFAKFATALAITRLMSKENFSIKRMSDLLMAGLIIALPAIFIIAQPDTGSAMVYSAFLLVFYRQGMPLWILLLVLILPFLFIATLIYSPIYVIIVIWVLAIGYYIYFERLTPYLPIVPISIAICYYLLFYLFKWISLKWNTEHILLLASAINVFWLGLYGLIRRRNIIITSMLLITIAFAFTQSVEIVFDKVLKEHQRNRIDIMLGIKDDPLGVGYNLNQSKIAIGSGGISGKGFLQGTQTKYNFVPEQSTDFIFCTVGEEWGFIGTFIVLTLFLFLLLRLILMAERQRWAFARIYGYCVASILFFHVGVNIAMTIGIFPVIGIPLPFFSYGGSSLWAFTILLFIFVNMDARRLEIMH